MSETPRIVAIIPARGGSKGLPRKNIRVVGGLPLIAHSINVCRAVSVIEAVFVSTDDSEIASVARAYGAEVIDRPAELASDHATSESALVHALATLRATGRGEPDIVIFLQPTSPRRQPGDLVAALQRFRDEKLDSLFSATPATMFMWRVGPDGPRPMNYDPTARARRQDAPLDVSENGSFYLFKPAVLERHNSRLGGKIGMHMMRGEDSFQVDDEWELELLDWMFERDAGG
jgi:CMP-N,N'-diacetyllegionaminic acid synthase